MLIIILNKKMMIKIFGKLILKGRIQYIEIYYIKLNISISVSVYGIWYMMDDSNKLIY